jgi:hypothetical protein
MLELRGELDLSLESLDVDGSRELRRQNLYHNLSLERRVFGNEHSRHSTAAKLALEGVGAAKRFLKLFP